MTCYMAVQYEWGIWRTREGSVPTKLPVHALPSIGTAAPREGSHSGASSPPYPHLPRLASRTSFAHLSCCRLGDWDGLVLGLVDIRNECVGQLRA